MIFGRETEIQRVQDLLDDWALVTVIGPGGVGKTTLAKEAAAGLGTLGFADLTAIVDRDLPDQIAGQLGHPSFGSFIDAAGIGDLVVLDNCEHLLEPVGDIVEEMTGAGMRVLATSRRPLGVEGEFVYRLSPMSIEGRPSPAALLLIEFLKARGLPDVGYDDDLEALASSLDGLPLALELASARAPSMTPAEIRQNLDSRIDLLSRSRSRTPDRHRSLDAAIGWSHDLLSEGDRAGLELLGVFDGAFDLGCASAAVGKGETETLDLLGDLIDASLLTAQTLGDRTWYRLYDTVRAFCRRRLDDDEFTATVSTVLDHVEDVARALTFPQERRHTLDVPRSVAALYPTIREAVEWCLRSDSTGERVFRMIAPLWWMEDQGHQAEISDLARRALQKWPGPATGDRAVAMAVLATLDRVTLRWDEAWTTASQVIDEAEDGLGLAQALRTAGMVKRSVGEFDDAVTYLKRSSELARAIGYSALALEVQMHIGLDLARRGDVEAGISVLRAALTQAESGSLTLTWLQTMLAYMLLVVDADEAIALASGVADGQHGDVDPWSLGWARSHVASAHTLEGRVQDAAGALLGALEIFESHNIVPGMWGSCWSGAALMARAGLPEWEQRSLATSKAIFGVPVSGPFELELYRRMAGHDQPAISGAPASLKQIRSQLERLATGSGRQAASAGSSARLSRSADRWDIDFAGVRASVPDSKGMLNLAELVSRPRTELAALDLMGGVLVQSGSGEILDDEARAAYRERVVELEETISESEGFGDLAKAESARAELDALLAQLSAAYGLGGRARETGGAAERARSAVTWRIRSSISRIAESHPSAGDHLRRYVSTGRFCVYDPPTDIAWVVDVT